MGARRFWGVTAVALSAIAGGCQPQTPPPPSPTAQGSSVAQSTPAAAASTQPADAASADALARKAEEWAKMLEALRAKREQQAATQPALQPVPPATQPVTISAATQPETKAEPTPAKPSPGASIVFAAPATTAPVIQISPPATPTTQQSVAPPSPKVVVKDALAERAEAAIKSAPRDAAAHLDHQLVRFLRDQQTPDLSTLSNLPVEDREAISAVMDGLANFRAVLRGDPNAMASKKVRPLVDMADRLRATADLHVSGTAFCSAVRGYGAYDPLKTPFVAGRENRALVYCEINGFASRSADAGLWETKLTQELVLYRGDAEVWKKGKPDEIVDRCRNKRRDFYTMNLMSLPAALPAGSYTLKITVIDQIANRVAETTHPVTINNPGAGVAAGQ